MRAGGLSGWLQPASALKPLAGEGGYLPLSYGRFSPSQWLEQTPQHYDRLIGWSLGGVLALQSLALGVIRTRQLDLMAVPYPLSATSGYAPFLKLLRQNPTAAATWLADKTGYPCEVPSHDWPSWEQATAWLEALSHWHDAAPIDGVTIRLWHAVDDPIVPLEHAKKLAAQLGTTLNITPDGGHCPWKGIAHV